MYKIDRLRAIAENYTQGKEYKDSLNKLNRIDLVRFIQFMEFNYPELRVRVRNDSLVITKIEAK